MIGTELPGAARTAACIAAAAGSSLCLTIAHYTRVHDSDSGVESRRRAAWARDAKDRRIGVSGWVVAAVTSGLWARVPQILKILRWVKKWGKWLVWCGLGVGVTQMGWSLRHPEGKCYRTAREGCPTRGCGGGGGRGSGRRGRLGLSGGGSGPGRGGWRGGEARGALPAVRRRCR
jgi:hypothetical protein